MERSKSDLEQRRVRQGDGGILLAAGEGSEEGLPARLVGDIFAEDASGDRSLAVVLVSRPGKLASFALAGSVASVFTGARISICSSDGLLGSVFQDPKK